MQVKQYDQAIVSMYQKMVVNRDYSLIGRDVKFEIHLY